MRVSGVRFVNLPVRRVGSHLTTTYIVLCELWPSGLFLAELRTVTGSACISVGGWRWSKRKRVHLLRKCVFVCTHSQCRRSGQRIAYLDQICSDPSPRREWTC